MYNQAIKTHSDCPVCGSRITKDNKQSNSLAVNRVNTRSSSKARNFDAGRNDESSLQDMPLNPSVNTTVSQPSLTAENVKDVVKSLMDSQQAQIVQSI